MPSIPFPRVTSADEAAAVLRIRLDTANAEAAQHPEGSTRRILAERAATRVADLLDSWATLAAAEEHEDDDATPEDEDDAATVAARVRASRGNRVI